MSAFVRSPVRWPALALAGAVLIFGATACGDDDDAATDGAVLSENAIAIDARPADARVSIDVDTTDAFGSQFSGCGTSANPFVDRTAAGAARSITIVGTVYDPKCIRIKQGQSVTIDAESFHPLRAAAGNPGSEIVNSTSPLTVALNSTGVYGFYCNIHGSAFGGGLAGAIEVVP